MSIYIDGNIKEVYVGSDKIKEVYYGSELVYKSSKTGYWVDTGNVERPFSIANTPITNFSGTTNSITINGVVYSKDMVKEIHFDESYSSITTIPLAFLYNFLNLEVVNMDNLTSVPYIQQMSFYNSGSLKRLDLSKMINLYLIDSNSFTNSGIEYLTLPVSLGDVIGSFGANSIYIKEIISLNPTPPVLEGTPFPNAFDDPIIKVPAGSVNAYKNADYWSDWYDTIVAI